MGLFQLIFLILLLVNVLVYVLLNEKLFSVLVLIMLFVILFIVLLVFLISDLFFWILFILCLDVFVVGNFINICSVRVGYFEFKCVWVVLKKSCFFMGVKGLLMIFFLVIFFICFGRFFELDFILFLLLCLCINCFFLISGCLCRWR